MGIKWRCLIGLEANLIPSIPGCYAIYVDDELAYIGSSVNIRARLIGKSYEKDRYGHGLGRLNDRGRFATPWGDAKLIVVKYRPSFRFGDWAMIELRMIRRLAPKHNKQGSGRFHQRVKKVRPLTTLRGDRVERAKRSFN